MQQVLTKSCRTHARNTRCNNALCTQRRLEKDRGLFMFESSDSLQAMAPDMFADDGDGKDPVRELFSAFTPALGEMKSVDRQGNAFRYWHMLSLSGALCRQMHSCWVS